MAADNLENGGKSSIFTFHVNWKLIPLKAHYFLFFASFAGMGPAMILYCQKIGMSFSMIGTLYAVLPFVQFLSKLVTGSLADKFQRHKTAFMAGIFFMGTFIFSIKFIPMPLSATQEIVWLPENGALIQCGTHNTSYGFSNILLTVCDESDSQQKNDSDFGPGLAQLTATCNLLCDQQSVVEQISSLFCDEDHPNCFLSNRYSFYEVEGKPQTLNLTAVLREHQDMSQSVNNSDTCSTQAVASITIAGSMISVLTHINETSLTSCPNDVQVEFRCSSICTSKLTQMEDDQDLRTVRFVWIWIANLIAWCAYGTLISTSDAIVIYLLGDHQEDFGKTRLFGSFGWGLMAPIAGYIIDKASEGLPEKNYTPAFYMFLTFMTLDFIVNIPLKVLIPDKSKKLVKEVLDLFRRPDVVIMAFGVFANGVTMGFLWTFLVVYAVELGGTQFIIGLNYAVECFLSEIPLFVVSGWVVSKLGYATSMSLSLFCLGLKTFLYSLISDAVYMLIIALLHGVCYGLMYSSMTTYVGHIAPPGTIATLQGVYQGLLEGIGVGLGNLIGGNVYESLGGRETFLLFGLVTMGLAVVHYSSHCIASVIENRKVVTDEKVNSALTNSGAPNKFYFTTSL